MKVWIASAAVNDSDGDLGTPTVYLSVHRTLTGAKKGLFSIVAELLDGEDEDELETMTQTISRAYPKVQPMSLGLHHWGIEDHDHGVYWELREEEVES